MAKVVKVMGVGDIYRLKNFQTWGGQQVLNVYYYEQTAGSGGAESLNIAFTLDVLPLIRPLQVANLFHTSLESEELDNPADFDSVILGALPGTASGENMPNFVSWGFLLSRATKTTRHGHKRYAGVGESDVSSGGAAAGALTRLNALAAALEGGIDDALGNEFILRIVGNPDDPGTRVINSITSVGFQRVTTQNTRKIGVGS